MDAALQVPGRPEAQRRVLLPHTLHHCLPITPAAAAVPLLIGHGGNTGSQSNATVIRALALGHLRSSDWLMVVYKVRWCIHCVQ